ncbi:MAG: hypothetical protein RLY71_442 [Pseudomonadota bacterium]
MATTAPAAAAAAAFGFNTPFEQQLAFFRQKLDLPTEHWDDITRRAHDRAFIVAGAAKADLLADLRGAVDDAIAKGTGLEAFRKQFKTIVAARGWTGWTGEGSAAGVAWRTKVIYQTNLATSFAAGRWAQLTDPATAEGLPFWRYVHRDSVLHPRPQHEAWNGLTLPLDHPFWQSHFPPNGWGCGCKVRPERKVPPGAPTTPPDGWDQINPKTGAPMGIDKGFDYAPGATWHPNLDKYPFETARAVVAENLKDGVFERWMQHIEQRATEEKALPKYTQMPAGDVSMAVRKALSTGERIPVAVLDDRGLKALKIPTDPAGGTASGHMTHTVWLSDDTAIKQTLHRQGQQMPVGGYVRLQQVLDQAEYVESSGDTRLVYYHEGGDVAVAVIKAAADGSDLFLVSMRRSSQRELTASIRAGKAIRWER